MTVFVALLRAVNVGGTGKLAMSVLRRLCEDAGFEGAQTHIQSGNVVFRSRLGEAKVKEVLEKALLAEQGKRVDVLVRTLPELERLVRRNPFAHAPPNRLLILFLDRPEPKNALAGLTIPGREEVKLSGREVFIHYPDGMGRSKLKLPFAKTGTARNLNTVRKLIELGKALDA